MTEHQREMTEDLKLTLEELDGDIIALENLCRCMKKNVKNFSEKSIQSCVKRTLDYIQQHTQDIQQIAEFLCRDMVTR